jgi:hypothetical protein
MAETKLKKQRLGNYQNGPERPHFFGFQPPKKSCGVAPARWLRKAKPYDGYASPAELRFATSVGAWDMSHADLHAPPGIASRQVFVTACDRLESRLEN